MSTEFFFRTGRDETHEFALQSAGWQFSFTQFTLRDGTVVNNTAALRELLLQERGAVVSFGSRWSGAEFLALVSAWNSRPNNFRNAFVFGNFLSNVRELDSEGVCWSRRSHQRPARW